MQLTVVHGKEPRLTIACDAQSLVQDVLRNASSRAGVDWREHALVCQGRELDPSTPVRLLNLPQGISVSLAKRTRSANGARVKLAVTSSWQAARVVIDVAPTDTVLSALRAYEARSGVLVVPAFESGDVSVLVLSKQLGTMADVESTTFDSLGVRSGSLLMRVQGKMPAPADTAPMAGAGAAPAPTAPPAQAPPAQAHSPGIERAPMPDRPHAEAAKSSPDKGKGLQRNLEIAPAATYLPREEEVPELTVSQAQHYQNMLAQRARGPSNGVFMTREQRAALAHKPSPVERTRVKIQFPDRSHAMADFGTSDTVGHLYDFVRSLLRHPVYSFKLWIGPPHRDLANLAALLIGHEGFVQRMAVHFEWTAGDMTPQAREEPVLRDEVLAESVSTRGPQSDDASHALDARQQQRPAPAPVRSGTNSTKIPKWLKLGKK